MAALQQFVLNTSNIFEILQVYAVVLNLYSMEIYQTKFFIVMFLFFGDFHKTITKA